MTHYNLPCVVVSPVSLPCILTEMKLLCSDVTMLLVRLVCSHRDSAILITASRNFVVDKQLVDAHPPVRTTQLRRCPKSHSVAHRRTVQAVVSPRSRLHSHRHRALTLRRWRHIQSGCDFPISSLGVTGRCFKLTLVNSFLSTPPFFPSEEKSLIGAWVYSGRLAEVLNPW